MTDERRDDSPYRDVVEQAYAEIEAERRREKVEQVKGQIRAARWWHRLFPWRITITKRTP